MLSYFTIVDYMIAFIIILSVIISLIRGFVREALSLATWGLALWVTFIFADRLSNKLVPYVSAPVLRMGASIAVLFLVTLAIGIMCSYFLTKLVNKSGLSGTDRLVGTVFGASRGVLIVGLAVLGLGLTPITQTTAWQTSMLVPYFEPMASWFTNDLPEYMRQRSEQQSASTQDHTVDNTDEILTY